MALPEHKSTKTTKCSYCGAPSVDGSYCEKCGAGMVTHDDYHPDCPACLRDRPHTIRHHNERIAANHACSR